MKRLLGAIAVALLLGAGCGKSAAQGAATKSPPTPSATNPPAAEPTHRMAVGSLSLTVPKDWTEGNQVRATRTPVSDQSAFVLLPKLSPDRGQGITQSPLNKSPFASEQLFVHDGKGGNQADLNLSEVSSDGAFYVLNVVVPASEVSELKTVAASIKAPPVATVNDIVGFMKRGANSGQGLHFTTAKVGTHRWILASGDPATAQEEFALYRSSDGGRTWTLATWTTFRGKNSFMGLVGAPDMFFWTKADGVIVESSAFLTKQLLIYSTEDDGTTWASMRLTTPGQPKSAAVSREANGELLLEAALTSGKVYKTTSADGGKTWSR